MEKKCNLLKNNKEEWTGKVFYEDKVVSIMKMMTLSVEDLTRKISSGMGW